MESTVAKKPVEVFSFTLTVDRKVYNRKTKRVESTRVRNATREICNFAIMAGGERRARALLRGMQEALRSHVHPISRYVGVRRVGQSFIVAKTGPGEAEPEKYFPAEGDTIELRWPAGSEWKTTTVTKVGVKEPGGDKIFWPAGWEHCGPLLAHHEGEIWRKPA